MREVQTMNETAYRAWQVLHDRWAKGETLTPEEQAVYEAGCAELEYIYIGVHICYNGYALPL